LNAALSWEAAGDKARAAGEFAQAIATGELSDAQSSAARKRLDELKPQLGVLRVSGVPGAVASAAHVQGVQLPFETYVSPGTVEVRQTGPDGRVTSTTVTIGAGESKLVTFEAVRTASDGPAAASATASPIASETNPQRTVAFVALGGAALGVVASSLLGIAALGAKSDYEDGGYTSRSDYDRANGLRDATNVAWITTGVLGVAGLVLYFTSSSARRSGVAGAIFAPWVANGPLRTTW
jgi:hypothetical protein